ncbi:MAG: DNA polymerase III subunit chi [Candidatus Nitrotoga sp.]|nr:DNA polymerase III subunit chi [Candidatus Nitrotoga sp.]MDO9448624.1 DNA polymerase III subunit chi [Candidatus Nitrotoga sp.]MDP3496543.1 DNA polymerase III subunit chi [Candidatus Nitrotoga sp.]RFC40746.1 MAG: DNA polymerase III, chi subunit [Candidatus Nitrotoga sp. CP45]
MTKVDFYTGVDDKLRTACHLSHKAMQNGLRVLLHTPDETTTEALDKLLWQYPVTAFMPHCRNNEATAAEMPVVVDHQGKHFPHNEVLISLHTVCLPFFSRFERVLEIVSQDTEDARLGRERFSFYRDRGYEMRHFDLSKQAEY